MEGAIVRARDQIDALKASLPVAAEYAQLVAFIDPIDGTKEFCTGKGEQCSVCIGVADKVSGAVVGGLVYRPLCPQRSWAVGCKREGFADGKLRKADSTADSTTATAAGQFMCSNGGTSAFLKGLCTELGYELAPTGGAGNKALRVLESPKTCYIQDRGLSRWDTCGPQGVIEGHGGVLAKLQPLVAGAAEEAVLEPYHYLVDDHPDDFVPGLTRLTKYNARKGVLDEADKAKDAPVRFATSQEEILPYKNGLGVFALGSADADTIAHVHAAVRRAAEKQPPSFD
jgi:fructose-1,6-bisphosphatase/inositol monophosphatase family enzyme